jgi:hypothetical protein
VKYDENKGDDLVPLLPPKKKPFVQTNVSSELAFKSSNNLLNDYHTIKNENVRSSFKILKTKESTHKRNLPP